MGLFGKQKPKYVEIGRGYDITATGVALRKALLDGEPKQVFPLLKQGDEEAGVEDLLAMHLIDVVAAFSTAGNGDMGPFVAIVCDQPPACPLPENESGEPDQYMDFVCEKLFEGGLSMMVLQEPQLFKAPQYDQLLDSFIATYNWTKRVFTFQRSSFDGDLNVIVGIGKHFHTFDGVVATLISNRNLRRGGAEL